MSDKELRGLMAKTMRRAATAQQKAQATLDKALGALKDEEDHLTANGQVFILNHVATHTAMRYQISVSSLLQAYEVDKMARDLASLINRPTAL